MGMNIRVYLIHDCGQKVEADVYQGYNVEEFGTKKDHLAFIKKVYPEAVGKSKDWISGNVEILDDNTAFVRCHKCKKIVFYYRISV
jgi:hypothetical protein